MAKIGIYLPKYHRLGDEAVLKAIPESDVRREVLKIATKLTDLCGGCTQTEVTGWYKFSDGFLSEHPTIEIYCFCSPNNVGQIAVELKPLLADIKLRLAQDSIGLYVDDRFIAI